MNSHVSKIVCLSIGAIPHLLCYNTKYLIKGCHSMPSPMMATFLVAIELKLFQVKAFTKKLASPLATYFNEQHI